MKKIRKWIITIIIVSILINIMPISYANNTDNINFLDENFKKAVIELGYDSDNDGEISINEASKVSDLWIINKGIKYISDIKYFKNLKNVSINDNYIEDISSFISLDKLEYLELSGNKINYSPLRSYDEDTISIINQLKEKGVTIFGLHEQRLEYDADLIDGQPEYKVLFVYVKDIDANVKKDGELVNYKHTLSNEEILYFEECRSMFEKCVEKLSNYTINITTKKYVTQNVISDFSSEAEDIEDYFLFGRDIDEIKDIINEYDTVFVCAIYDDNIVYHKASGLGGVQYSDKENVYGDAMAYFHSTDVDEIEDLKDERITKNIADIIHEFIHTVEGYGIYMGFNIWEWHNAIGYYNDNNYNVSQTSILAASYYLQGEKNPSNDGSMGIPTHIWEITPSEIANKSVAINKSELDMQIEDSQKLYCSIKNDEYDGTSQNVWKTNIVWKSDNPEIAIVNENGVVTAKSVGQCKIIARDVENTHSIECIVNVVNNYENTIKEIEVTTLPTKKQYIQNYEQLDLTGGILTVTYNDETTDTISLTNENIKITGFDNTKIGTNTITVEYEGETTTFDVQIISKQACSIEVTTVPTKKQYIQNYEQLDLTGGILTITYNDDTTDTISLTNEALKVSGFDNTALGKNKINVEYNGLKTDFDVEIISKKIAKIELTTKPVKTQYIQNAEKIDLTGGVIKVTYNDKTTDTISLTNENIKVTGFDNSTVGNKTITIEYEGVKTSFSIEIIAKSTGESSKATGENNNSSESSTLTKDNTVATQPLPKTGKRNYIFIISIIVGLILAIALYRETKKYKNI